MAPPKIPKEVLARDPAMLMRVLAKRRENKRAERAKRQEIKTAAANEAKAIARKLRAEMRADLQKKSNARARRVMRNAELHPSVRSTEIVAAIAQNKKLYPETRAEASALLLKWGQGNFETRRVRQRTRKQANKKGEAK